MSSDPWAGPVFLFLIFLFLRGWFSAAKTALQDVNDTKLQEAADDGDRKAAQLLQLLEQRDRCLDALQVCITMCGLVGAVLVGQAFSGRLAALLTAWGISIATDSMRTLCLLLITLVTAFLIVVLGDKLPRRIAQQHSERVARLTLTSMRFSATLLTPAVWLNRVTCNGLLRLIGLDPNADTEEVTEEEIRAMVDMGGESGAIEETEKEMIENIFEFNNRSAEDVMTHRIDVTSIPLDASHDEIVEIILDTGLSRFPVYDEDIDDIIGILNTRDFLLDAHREHPRPLRELLREAYFVPETVQADTLFRDMQTRKVHMAIVVDEYGGMSGIVTMEDLLEEIVGNIYDEFDPQAKPDIALVDEGVWRISGSTTLEDIADALDVDLPLEAEYDTLSGLIFNQFTTIPKDGSTPEVDVAGLHIQVEIIADHRVESALVRKLPKQDAEASDDREAHDNADTRKKDDHE